MKPGQLDLPIIWRGCAWLDILLDWKDQDGNPIDLTGFTPVANLRDGTNLNAAIIGNPRNGNTKLSMTTQQTANLTLGVQDWDWLWGSTSPALVVLPPFLSGKVPIKQPKSRFV